MAKVAVIKKAARLQFVEEAGSMPGALAAQWHLQNAMFVVWDLLRAMSTNSGSQPAIESTCNPVSNCGWLAEQQQWARDAGEQARRVKSGSVTKTVSINAPAMDKIQMMMQLTEAQYAVWLPHAICRQLNGWQATEAKSVCRKQ
jgi:hypothetical protein